MGLNLGIKREVFGAPEDHSWLGSAHGTQSGDPITLDGDAFLTLFPSGVVPSGVVLGKVTSTGLYQPYSDAANTGIEVARYHLFTTTWLGGTTAAVVGKVPAAGFWHGEVIIAKLPTGHGLDAAAQADMKMVRYV